MRTLSIGSTVLRCLASLSFAALASAQMVVYDLDGYAAGNEFGTSARGAGDVNNDGIDDFIVGEPLSDTMGTDRGRAHVYSGRTGSLLHTFNGEAAYDNFGYSVDGGSDIDGDGFADLLVGAPAHDNGAGFDSGAVYLFSGRNGTLLRTHFGVYAGARFGHSVRFAGRINGDPVDDYLIGEPYYNSGGGRALVYSGLNGSGIRWHTGIGGLFGWSVARIGRVDLDAFDDYAVGAPSETVSGGNDNGVVRVFSGLTGIQSTYWYGANDSEWGFAIDGAGDADNDGYFDLVIGAPGDDSNGGDSGRVALITLGPGAALLHSKSGNAGSRLGASVSGAGDVNGDGKDDFMAGGPYFDAFAGANAGIVNVYSSVTGGTLHIAFGGEAGAYLGQSVCSVGDLNHDGRGDVLFASHRTNGNGTNSGSVQVKLMHLDYLAAPVAYCTAKTNSDGCVPEIKALGTTSLTVGDELEIIGDDIVPVTSGIMFWGSSTATIPFHGGSLCVAAPRIRTPIQSSGGITSHGCSGAFSFLFSRHYVINNGLGAGDEIYAQWWSRDPGFAAPNNVGLTDALHFEIWP